MVRTLYQRGAGVFRGVSPICGGHAMTQFRSARRGQAVFLPISAKPPASILGLKKSLEAAG